MLKQVQTAGLALVIFVLLTGVIYPLAVTGIAQLILSSQANGSIIQRDGANVGSVLLGQHFSHPGYFWGRPSSTSPYEYNASASSGSNLGPSNPSLKSSVEIRIAALRAADPANRETVPIDLVTSSGSGLDPHISVAAANYQVHRVAANRNISEDEVYRLVSACTEGRQFGILGEPRVNVLMLNLALDRQSILTPRSEGDKGDNGK